MANAGRFPDPSESRLQQDISQLSEFVDHSLEGWTRLAFTDIYSRARLWVKERMESAGLDTHVDAAANTVGRLAGKKPDLPSLVIGSHIDTVKGGGRFDGTIGVLAGIEVVRLLEEHQITLDHTLEIIDFTAEEPTEFGISTIGSKALAGNLSAQMLDLRDPSGRRLSEAIRAAGGTPEQIPAIVRGHGDIAGYLELHIEQGPILERTKNELGVVRGIVGIIRLLFQITGSPGHSGTTPMNLRRDALSGAAQMILALETLCRTPGPAPLVGTVGRILVSPNAPNVIAGETRLDVEIRSIDQNVMEQTVDALLSECRRIARERRLSFRSQRMSYTNPVHVRPEVLEAVRGACTAVTDRQIDIVSGAGHDANQIAAVAPVGMIFVPSAGGRSHCPEEFTDIRDIAKGTAALLRCVMALDTH